MRPPLICRALVRAAGWMAPRRIRPGWRSRWERRLRDWWTLVERGDLTTRSSREVCRIAVRDAWNARFGELRPEKVTRGPGFVLGAAALLIVLLATVTRGFAVTRGLIEIARGHYGGALHTLAPYGAMDRLGAHCFALGFAMLVGVMMVSAGGLPPRHRGCRYWGFLATKSLLATAIVTLAWVESGPALRAHIRNPELRALGGYLVWTLLFICGFGCSLAWSFADQRHRCPVCLRVLAMPVSIGCWASIFEPPETELLCEDGHGLLCVDETGAPADDHWSTLDASWKL